MELDGNYGLSQAEVEQINKTLEEEEQQKALAAQQQQQAVAAEEQAELPQPQQQQQEPQQVAEQPTEEDTGNGYNTGNAKLDADLERLGAPKPGTSDNPVIKTAEEISNAWNNGITKGLRSVTTAKERWQDMAAGEDVGSPDYEPEWDPFKPKNGPPMAQTWWSGIIQEGVKSAVIGATGFLALRGAAKVGVPGAKALSTGAATKAGVYGRSALAGAAEAAVDIDSQSSTMSDAIVQRVPFLEGPLSPLTTSPDDGPLLKTFKNIVENLGLVGVADWVSFKIGDGINAVKARRASVEKSTIEAGQEQLLDSVALRATDDEITQVATEFNTQNPQRNFDDLDVNQQAQLVENAKESGLIARQADTAPDVTGTYGAYKNKPLSDPWQAAPMSGKESAFEVLMDAQLIGKRADGLGSTDLWTTPKMAARLAKDPGQFEQYMTDTVQNLLGDKRYKEMLKDTDPNLLEPATKESLFRGAYDRYQEVMGRDVAAMDPAEFWEPMKRSTKKDGYLSTGEILATDLINAELFTQIRDIATAGREIGKFADLDDIDGPLKALSDRLVGGLTSVYRSRKLVNGSIGKNMTKSNLKELSALATEEAGKEATTQVEALLKLIRSDASTDTVDAVMEIFSMSNRPQNAADLTAYIRGEMGRTGLTSDKGKGMIFNELNAVTTNSLLSGPKTPLKALKGTAVVTVVRPLQTALGSIPGSLAGNFTNRAVLRSNMASLNAMREAVPEAMKLFGSKLRAYWAGDISTIKTRYSDYTAKTDAAWERQRWYAQDSGEASLGDQVAFGIANIGRQINNSTLFNYNTKIMAATDDAFRPLMARAHSRRKALYQALQDQKAGKLDILEDIAKRYEDNFYKDLIDENGDIDISKDTVLQSAFEESTLTTKLDGFGADLDALMQKNALTQPFFKFVRTRINEINLNYKSLPLLGLAHKNSIDIIRATDDNMGMLAKQGINTPEELANAKALLIGRQAFGTGLTFQATQFYMDGNLTGDGPEDPAVKASWVARGWKPRHIRIMGKWVSYDGLPPFNMILSSVANVGDNMKKMGPKWGEESFSKIALAISANEMDKAFFESFTPLQDLLSDKGGKVIAQLANNQVPLAALRGSVGKILTPYFRELDNDFASTIRNRNLTTENIAGDPLPIKSDVLNGEPLRDWNFWERSWAELNPFGLSIPDEPSAGRQLLERSMYGRLPVRVSQYDGINMKNNAPLRAEFQKGIGTAKITIGYKTYKNPEEALGALSKMPIVLNSLKQMEEDYAAGIKMEEKNYPHFDLIDNVFEQAQEISWAAMQDNPEVQALIDQKNQKSADEFNRKRELQLSVQQPNFILKNR